MPMLSTGYVIAGAYADKVRRVLFAQLREMIKRGEIDNSTVARRAGELNRLLFDIIVNRLGLDKGDVVRVRIEYTIENRDIKWSLETLRIEAFRRIPDDTVAKAVRDTVEEAEKVLAREATEEELAWTEAREREVERAVQRRAAEARASEAAAEKKPGEQFDIETLAFFGETREGEKIALLKSSHEDNIGIAIIEGAPTGSKAEIILVPEPGKAYKATLTLEVAPSRLEENPSLLTEAVKKTVFERIERSEAEKIIMEKLRSLQ